MRALIVDDDDFIRFLLVRTLQDFGFTDIVDFANAADAMKAAKAAGPTLAILDLDLGAGPNGIDLAHGLRKFLPALAIIVLSSYQDPRLLGANREMPDGAVYLSKREVNDAQILNETIARVLEHPRATSDSAPEATFEGRRLSDNQVEVMRLVAEGYSNAEIARRRYLTEPAVEKAIARLIKQLGLTPGKEDNSRVLITQAYYELIGATQVRRD